MPPSVVKGPVVHPQTCAYRFRAGLCFSMLISAASLFRSWWKLDPLAWNSSQSSVQSGKPLHSAGNKNWGPLIYIKNTGPWPSLPYGALNSPTARENWHLLGAGKQCAQTPGSRYPVIIIFSDPLKCSALPISATGISKDRRTVPKEKLTKGHINQGFH